MTREIEVRLRNDVHETENFHEGVTWCGWTEEGRIYRLETKSEAGVEEVFSYPVGNIIWVRETRR